MWERTSAIELVQSSLFQIDEEEEDGGISNFQWSKVRVSKQIRKIVSVIMMNIIFLRFVASRTNAILCGIRCSQ